jgi:hypothetical protein
VQKECKKYNCATAGGVYQLNRPDCGNKYAGHTAGIMRKNVNNIYSPLKTRVKVHPTTDQKGPGVE